MPSEVSGAVVQSTEPLSATSSAREAGRVWPS